MCTRPHAASLVVLVALLVGTNKPLLADVELAPIFSANMVLQAEMPAAIFGTAPDGEQVAVELAGQKKATVAQGESGG